jgi:alpha-glucosidase
MKQMYMIQFTFFVAMIVIIVVSNVRAGEWKVTSPDGSIEVTINESPTFQYRITKDGKDAISSSPLGVTFSSMNLTTGIQFVSEEMKTVNDPYEPVHGTKSIHMNHYNQLILNLKNGANNQFALEFRVFNEGAAFRYVIKGTGSAMARSEASSFTLPSGSVTWRAQTQGEYQARWNYISGTQNGSFQVPVLAKTSDDIYVLLHEAAVYGTFCASHFRVDGLKYRINYDGSPSCALPLEMPWRLAMIGDLKNIVENSQQTTENLNLPNEISDVSWIKPGRVSWSWLTQGVSDLNQQKRYVDFSKAMGWEYCLVDAGWRRTNMASLAPYAKSQGVGLILWYSYDETNTATKINNVMNECRGYEVKGIKVDYVWSDDREHMQWYEDITRAAYEAKLLINFHGCTIPRGQSRRWPNFMTAEAIYGAEQNMSTPKVPVEHNCIVPYTRGAVAPMDYTPVLLSKVTKVTKTQELAHSVVYYSSLQHFCDNPNSYNSADPSVIQYFKDIPASWDDMRFLCGDPGNYICIARRKGDDWWIAGITNEERTVDLDLSFLAQDSYSVDLYTDRSGSREMQLNTVTLTSPGTKSITMEATGGFCCHIPDSYSPTHIQKEKVHILGYKNKGSFSIAKTSGKYRITVPDARSLTVTLFSISGKTLSCKYETNSNSTVLPVTGLRPGIYMIRVQTEGYTMAKRIIHK